MYQGPEQDAGQLAVDDTQEPLPPVQKSNKWIYITVGVIVVLLCFAASELGIYVGGKFKPLSASAACPIIDLSAFPVVEYKKQR